MKSDIGCERWQVAQTLELKDWEFGGIVENETEEIRIKYSLFLKNLSKRIFFNLLFIFYQTSFCFIKYKTP